MRTLLQSAAAALAATLLLSHSAVAQQPAPTDPGWDGERVIELVRLAELRRAETYAADGLRDYQADAEGYVYFYLDLPEEDERILVRTDQIALETAWMAPGFTRQVMVGRRHRDELPTRIRYYRDRLVTVMDNFGDRIVIADGDNVRDVPHPIGPEGESNYHYRLADSVALRLPGRPDPVRVMEVEVRPRDTSRPATIGSVFLDGDSGAIVRMSFTFTAASYVDPEVDHIRVSLEHGLWEGRYWLPYEQRLEVRRELRGLDLPAGSVIRAHMRIGNYRFNQDLPRAYFQGPSVVSLPADDLAAHPFEEALHAQLAAEGLRPDPDLGALQTRAREMARERALSGLPRLRAHLPAASDLVRFNRAEGLAIGAGASLRPGGRETIRVHSGWAFGPQHPWGRVEASAPLGGSRLTGRGYLNAPGDIGVGPAASGIATTLAALVGTDLTDPFYRSGGSAGVVWPLGAGWSIAGDLRLEDHRSASLEAATSPVGDRSFRPVRPVDEGAFLGTSLGVRRAAAAHAGRRWTASARVEGGRLSPAQGDAALFVQPRIGALWERRWPDAGNAPELRLEAEAGATLGELPRQALYLVGGRGTIPGHPFRAYGGDRFATARAAISADILDPWLRGRAFAGGGWAGLGAPARPAAERWEGVPGWEITPTGAPRFGVGAGVGLLYDMLRIDVARGLGPGGGWELIVETRPAFWGFL